MRRTVLYTRTFETIQRSFPIMDFRAINEEDYEMLLCTERSSIFLEIIFDKLATSCSVRRCRAINDWPQST